MIKTIIFDIGGVLFQTNFPVMYSNFAKRVGLTLEFVIEYHKKNIHDLILGNITLEQFWKDMIDAGANPKLDLRAIWIDEGVKNREINQELLLIIKNLRKNYSVGALTNIIPSRLILDDAIGLYDNFDYAVLSFKEHLRKPDHEFYKLSLKIASTRPEEAIFVDDKETCVAAAEEIGIKSIIYTYPDNKKLLGDLERLGVIYNQ